AGWFRDRGPPARRAALQQALLVAVGGRLPLVRCAALRDPGSVEQGARDWKQGGWHAGPERPGLAVHFPVRAAAGQRVQRPGYPDHQRRCRRRWSLSVAGGTLETAKDDEAKWNGRPSKEGRPFW